MTEETRRPIRSKDTNNVLGLHDEQGVYYWNKHTKQWECVSWEWLQSLREQHVQEQIA